jgi:hypothetical protein
VIPGCSDCLPAEHAAIKERVEYFLLETDGHQQWAGLLTGQCKVCFSTLALECCAICTTPMPTTDMLPWGEPSEERHVHFECGVRLLVTGRRGRFVILAGKTVAKEFDTVALAAGGGK